MNEHGSLYFLVVGVAPLSGAADHDFSALVPGTVATAQHRRQLAVRTDRADLDRRVSTFADLQRTGEFGHPGHERVMDGPPSATSDAAAGSICFADVGVIKHRARFDCGQTRRMVGQRHDRRLGWIARVTGGVELGGHQVLDLDPGVGGIPMDVVGDMTVPVVSALGVPIRRVTIVPARVVAVVRRFGKARGPDSRDAVGRFDPSAKTRHVAKGIGVLRRSGEPHDLDLHGAVTVGLDSARRMPQCPGGDACIDMLINYRLIDRKMRIGFFSSEAVEGRLGAGPFGRVVDDLERAARVIAGRSGDGMLRCEGTESHFQFSPGAGPKSASAIRDFRNAFTFAAKLGRISCRALVSIESFALLRLNFTFEDVILKNNI